MSTSRVLVKSSVAYVYSTAVKKRKDVLYMQIFKVFKQCIVNYFLFEREGNINSYLEMLIFT